MLLLKTNMKIKKVHLVGVGVLIVYYTLSKMIFFSTIISSNPLVYLIIPYVFGSVAAVIFLYIFSHEEFFSFAKEIEKKSMKKENKLLKRFGNHGKVTSMFLISIFGGPVFSALTARLLLKNFKYKYYLVVIANIPATIWTIGSSKGLLSLIF